MQEEKSSERVFSSQQSDQIVERATRALELARWKRADLARATRLSSGYLSDVFTRKKPMTHALVVRVAAALQVNSDWLATGDGSKVAWPYGAPLVDTPAAPGVSSAHGEPGDLSPGQVGALLAAVERERLTPDQRRLLALFDTLTPGERTSVLADLEAKHIKERLAAGHAPLLSDKSKGDR